MIITPSRSLVFLLLVSQLTSSAFCQTAIRDRIREKLKASVPSDVMNQERNTRKIQLGGREVAVWESAKDTRSPLLLFSHGFCGRNTQSSALMKEFSQAGFTIMAPSHADANCLTQGVVERPRFGKPQDWDESKFKNRKDDLVAVLEAAKKDPAWSERLDFTRIGLVGHSLGGYTVLAMSGAYPSWQLPGVRAILGLSPYAQPLIKKELFKSIAVPMMLQGGTRDLGITPALKRAGGAFDQAQSPAFLVVVEGAGHFAWTDADKVHLPSIAFYGTEFMKKFVMGDSKADLTIKRADIDVVKAK